MDTKEFATKAQTKQRILRSTDYTDYADYSQGLTGPVRKNAVTFHGVFRQPTSKCNPKRNLRNLRNLWIFNLCVLCVSV
jgi:hypothetical protein